VDHVGVGDIKAGAGTTSGGSGKKIVYAEIAIAVVILAIVLIAKFGYNIDLLNPASGEMSLARSQGNSAGPGFKNVSQSTRIQTNEFQQSINQSPMQNPNQSFNLQYLELQQQMQGQNKQFSMTSNVQKTKHDTAKNNINNIR
jgi:hypothetical protein